jgi:hypothetical protein
MSKIRLHKKIRKNKYHPLKDLYKLLDLTSNDLSHNKNSFPHFLPPPNLNFDIKDLSIEIFF